MGIKVTTRAATARIQRRLAQDGERLVKIRESSRDYAQYGPYIIVDNQTNGIVASGCTVEGLVEELELLKQFEELA